MSRRRAPARRTRVCFVLSYAYGLLKPESGLPVGGAEVQIVTLATQLATDPRFHVSVLTANGDARGREQIGGITVFTSPMWGLRPSDPARRTALLTRTARTVVDGTRRLFRHDGPVERVARFWIARARYAKEQVLGPAAACDPSVPTWLPDALKRWVRMFRRIGADIYVVRCASAHVGFARSAAHEVGAKFVYMVAHEDELTGAYVARDPIGSFFEEGLRRADVVICQHGQQMELLHARYGTSRSALHIPSLLPVAVGGPPADSALRDSILWIARLDTWKRPDLIAELATQMPEERFVIVAPRSETGSADVVALQQRIGALRNVRWIERVPFAQTHELFDCAKIFVNTSSREGFPNTFLQAAARGTPIVSWSVDPDKMLQRFQMGFCAGEDWDSFVDSVRRVSTNAALRERVGENGRAYVRTHHDPAQIAAQYGDLFEALQGKEPVSPGAAAAGTLGAHTPTAEDRHWNTFS